MQPSDSSADPPGGMSGQVELQCQHQTGLIRRSFARNQDARYQSIHEASPNAEPRARRGCD